MHRKKSTLAPKRLQLQGRKPWLLCSNPGTFHAGSRHSEFDGHLAICPANHNHQPRTHIPIGRRPHLWASKPPINSLVRSALVLRSRSGIGVVPGEANWQYPGSEARRRHHLTPLQHSSYFLPLPHDEQAWFGLEIFAFGLVSA